MGQLLNGWVADFFIDLVNTKSTYITIQRWRVLLFYAVTYNNAIIAINIAAAYKIKCENMSYI